VHHVPGSRLDQNRRRAHQMDALYALRSRLFKINAGVMRQRTKTVLCVGGPRAGQMVTTSEDVQVLKIAMPPRLALEGTSATTPEIFEYLPLVLSWPDEPETITMWTPADQSPRETLKLLLETYEIHRKRRG
jgi:hypothetical protein